MCIFGKNLLLLLLLLLVYLKRDSNPRPKTRNYCMTTRSEASVESTPETSALMQSIKLSKSMH